MADPSLAELLPRLAGSMVVVIGLMWLAARLMKNRQGGGLRIKNAKTNSNPIEVVARHSLGRHSSIAVVRTGDKTLVLGITDQNVSLLSQLDEITLEETTELDVHGTDVENPAWTGLLAQVREKTVRR